MTACFLRPEVPVRNVYRPVHTVGVAPTLSAYLRIKPPSGSRAEPLVEALRARRSTIGPRASHDPIGAE